MKKQIIKLYLFEILVCITPACIFLPLVEWATGLVAAATLAVIIFKPIAGVVVKACLWGWSLYYAVTTQPSWLTVIYFAAGVASLIYNINLVKSIRNDASASNKNTQIQTEMKKSASPEEPKDNDMNSNYDTMEFRYEEPYAETYDETDWRTDDVIEKIVAAKAFASEMYDKYKNDTQIKDEAQKLREIVNENGSPEAWRKDGIECLERIEAAKERFLLKEQERTSRLKYKKLFLSADQITFIKLAYLDIGSGLDYFMERLPEIEEGSHVESIAVLIATVDIGKLTDMLLDEISNVEDKRNGVLLHSDYNDDEKEMLYGMLSYMIASMKRVISKANELLAIAQKEEELIKSKELAKKLYM